MVCAPPKRAQNQRLKENPPTKINANLPFFITIFLTLKITHNKEIVELKLWQGWFTRLMMLKPRLNDMSPLSFAAIFWAMLILRHAFSGTFSCVDLLLSGNGIVSFACMSLRDNWRIPLTVFMVAFSRDRGSSGYWQSSWTSNIVLNGIIAEQVSLLQSVSPSHLPLSDLRS